VLGSLTNLMAASSTSQSNSGQSLILLLVLMVGVFYFLLIRPQQRRARSQRALMQGLDVGDEVITIGGVHGTIRELDDDSVLLEVAPEVDIRFLRSAIARKLVYEDEDDTDDDQVDEHDHAEEADEQT
jgi:preprotein translocase subunit YajC